MFLWQFEALGLVQHSQVKKSLIPGAWSESHPTELRSDFDHSQFCRPASSYSTRVQAILLKLQYQGTALRDLIL